MTKRKVEFPNFYNFLSSFCNRSSAFCNGPAASFVNDSEPDLFTGGGASAAVVLLLRRCCCDERADMLAHE